jgi:hypothetical protein
VALANTLAYYEKATITAAKSFMGQVPEDIFISLISLMSAQVGLMVFKLKP